MGSIYRRKLKRNDGTIIELPTLWIKYYQNGRAVRESTGTTKETVACRVLRSREGDVEHGVPINPKMGLISFEEAADDFLNDYKVNRRKTHAHAKRRIEKHLKPVFKGQRLFSITTPKISAFITARLEAKASVPLVFHRNGARIKSLRGAWKRHASRPARPGASSAASAGLRRGTSSATACHAPRRWRW